MKRAVLGGLVLGMLAGAVQACVKDPIQTMVLENGSKVEVVARGDGRLTLVHSAMGQSWTQELWMGFVPLSVTMSQGVIRWKWDSTLPDVPALIPGASLQLTGQLVQPNGEIEDITTTLLVLAEATNSIGGCDYPVLRIEMRDVVDGQLVAHTVQDLHVPSLLVLNIVTIDPASGEERPDPVASVQ
jgi:hypothetical protein